MKDVVQFLAEVKNELGKVVWPKVDEWIGSTIIMIILVFACALYLGAVDFGLSKLAGLIFKSYSLN
ncbi:MAG: preprotein translocase subunit SecE [Candidatus Dependentiae bacterium]